jgi:O-antigen/teichoic acid export membrane protein
VVRELARDRSSEGATLGTVAGIRLAGGLLGLVLAVVTAFCTEQGDARVTMALVAFVAAGNLLQAFDVVDWTFQAQGNFRRGTLARLVAFIVGALLKLAAAFSGAGVVAIAAVTLVEMALAAVLQLIAWWRVPDRAPRWFFERAHAASLLRLAAPLLAGELAVWLFQRADVLILRHFAGDADVGLYSVAQRMAQVAFFLPVLAVQVLSPRVARAGSEVEALALVGRAMNLLVGAAYLLSLGLWLASGVLVRGLFGPAYAAAAPALAWLAWTNVFVFMGCAHTLYLVNRDAQKLSFRLAWLTAGVSVALNLLLVPGWQARGAAMASVGAYGLTTVFGVALFPASRPLLAVNLKALAAPVWLVESWWRARRAPAATP